MGQRVDKEKIQRLIETSGIVEHERFLIQVVENILVFIVILHSIWFVTAL
jgi:hypothetical protein